jgi:leucyl-tRNA synthetase
MITNEGYRDPSHGMQWVPLGEVEWRDGKPYRQGTELIPETGKMSKSRYNVVPPDELIERYGADTERVYTLFIAPPEKEAAWSDEGVVGAYRFLGRVWAMGEQLVSSPTGAPATSPAPSGRLVRKLHQTIDAVTRRFERFEFNTAISSLMELSNALGESLSSGADSAQTQREAYLALLQMLHPLAPHLTEEFWERFGMKGFILTSKWPVADRALMQEDVVTIVVQVNGKLRGQIEVPNPAVEDAVMAAVKSHEKIQTWVEGKQVVKTIYVPGKLVNVVVR